MGSDSRDCEGCDIDKEGGGGSDTTILVHLSADRSRAYAVSIPRDSIVDRPEDGLRRAGGTDVMWNVAYDSRRSDLHAGASSRQNTGIRVEHFVVVDFGSFGKMVDAVGGVPVCVPEDIVDRPHEIFVPEGRPVACSPATRPSTTCGPATSASRSSRTTSPASAASRSSSARSCAR